jgi:hypothetical protein
MKMGLPIHLPMPHGFCSGREGPTVLGREQVYTTTRRLADKGSTPGGKTAGSPVWENGGVETPRQMLSLFKRTSFNGTQPGV